MSSSVSCGGFLFSILFTCAIFLTFAAAKPEWTREKISHEPSKLTSSQLKKLCQTDTRRLNNYLDNILVPRIAGTQSHRKVGNFIISKLKNLGYNVETQEFRTLTPNGAKTFRNIMAQQDTSAKRLLTLACHYDSKDCLTRQGTCSPYTAQPFEFLGATDSALPCSLMLELAASLKPYMGSRSNKDLSLQLLFLDGEEAFNYWTSTDSLYGSRALANKWHREPARNGAGGRGRNRATRLDQIDAFVLLDLLGAANPTIGNMLPNKESLYLHLPMIENDLKATGCLKSKNNGFLSILSDRAGSQMFQSIGRGAVTDDHIPFQQYGVPIIHVISSPFPRVWHTIHDNREALDDNTIWNLAAVLRVFVAQYLKLTV